jgi:hypothetical protein
VHPSHGRPRGHRPSVRPSENVRVTTLIQSASFKTHFNISYPKRINILLVIKFRRYFEF